MKLCIVGDRDCDDYLFLVEALKASKFKIKDVTEVVHGDAKGADRLGKTWGETKGLFVKSFPAEWKNLNTPGAIVKEGPYGPYNYKAGFDRNQKMAEYADAFVVLQPNGITPGSADIAEKAKKLNKPVYVHTGQKEGKKSKF